MNTLQSQDIRTSLTAFDNLGNSRTVTIGINSTATDGIDGPLGEFILPPSIPGNFDFRIIDSDIRPVPLLGNGVWTDLRGIFTGPPIVQQFEIQARRAIGAASTFLSWPLPLAVGVTSARLTSYPNSAILDVDMAGQSQVLLPVGTNRYVLTVTYGGPALQRYTLNTQVDPPGTGQVMVLPMQPDYASGSTVLLLGLDLSPPDTCYTFSRWSGDASGNNPVYMLTMDGPKNVTAHFVKRQFPLTVSSLTTFTVVSSPPPSQLLRIGNSGLACVQWTASASDPWIGISKTSGTGDDSIRVSIISSSIPCAGTHIGRITITSDASIPQTIDIPVIVVVGRGDLSATVFGNPLILSCESKAGDLIFVTVHNAGLAPLTFPSSPPGSRGFILKNPGIFPLTVQPDDSARLYYEFHPEPSQRGVITDNVILSASQCGKQVLFKLTGTRVAPTVTADVNELDFGRINDCTIDPLPSRSVILTNAHTQPAQLRYTLPSGFTFTSQPSAIPAGGSATITLQPLRAGVATIDDMLSIEADFGVCQEVFAVRLSGKRQKASFLVDAVATPGTLPPQLFDTTCVGSYSQPKAVRISNNGTAELVITLAIAPPFEIDAFSSPFTLPAGESRIVNIRFRPTAAGSFNQTLSISADQCALSSVVALRGSTFSQQVLSAAIAPANVALANCEPEARIRITVTNTGTQPVLFTALPALPNGFEWDSTTTLPVSIAANPAAPFVGTIVFRPPLGQSGSFTGSVEWFGQPCGTSVYFTLTGLRVLPQIAITPRELDFGEIVDCGVGGALAPQAVTVTNTSALPVTVTATAPVAFYTLMSGALPFPSQGMTISANSSLDITVFPKYGSGGAFHDSLRLGIFAGTGGSCSESMAIPLTGSRFKPGFALREPTVDAFDGVCVGTKTVQSWLIENTGDRTLTFTATSFPLSSAFALLSTPFRTTVAPGQSKELPVRFSPTAIGAQQAILTLTSDACPDGLTFTFRGKAVQPSFAVTAVTPRRTAHDAHVSAGSFAADQGHGAQHRNGPCDHLRWFASAGRFPVRSRRPVPLHAQDRRNKGGDTPFHRHRSRQLRRHRPSLLERLQQRGVLRSRCHCREHRFRRHARGAAAGGHHDLSERPGPRR
ncbi:MAG: choice-of-anchor D domain-containing protein [Ignavibacteria bacterium]|nr:choice-of-anchor D domain-containing protein [Ignavibacteria bacterium]